MIERALAVVAHPDDEVLMAGGLLARLRDRGAWTGVITVCDGESSRNGSDLEERLAVRRRALNEAALILGLEVLGIGSFPDNRLDQCPQLDVVQFLERYVNEVTPDLVVSHHPSDLNIDHRLVAAAVGVATRPRDASMPRVVLAGEVPSSTEWSVLGNSARFSPNVHIDISASLERKVAAFAAYGTEVRVVPHPRSLDAVRALAVTRGAAAGFKAAEAFEIVRARI